MRYKLKQGTWLWIQVEIHSGDLGKGLREVGGVQDPDILLKRRRELLFFSTTCQTPHYFINIISIQSARTTLGLIQCWWDCKSLPCFGELSLTPQMVKKRVIIWPSNPTPKYTLKGNENICPCEEVYTSVHAALFTIAQEEKQPKCSPAPISG